jgi:NAD(P)-dependent dehydrogenase (short-subunit alcohol dehydrogenase family)
LKPHSTYLITGGLGGLGLALAQWLAARTRGKLALLTRSAFPEATRWPSLVADASTPARLRGQLQALQHMIESGAEVEVITADVADLPAVRDAVRQVRRRFGALDGVFHLAGVLQDGLLRTAGEERFRRIAGAKVEGAWNLYQALAEAPPGFLVLYSSLAGVLGNVGQADYAAANRCLDSFASWCSARGLPTSSVDWGPWGEAGVAVRSLAAARERGVEGLRTAEALDALHRVLTQGVGQAAVFRATRPLLAGSIDAVPPSRVQGPGEAWRAALVRLLEEALNQRLESADLRRPVTELGVDSILAVRLAQATSELVGQELPRTLWLDAATLDQLVETLNNQFQPDTSQLVSGTASTVHDAGERRPVAAERSRSTVTKRVHAAQHGLNDGAMAVIGMSGRFPGAVNLDQFWTNLVSGLDAVGRVPDSSASLSPTGTPWEWAGLLEDSDRFDPQFFGISPREAAEMDPQQRLLLEVVWETLEAAGRANRARLDSRTGVFVGAMPSEYLQSLLARGENVDRYVATGNAMSVIANRLSYWLNLRGPCLSIDTACSSSLVAVHLAVKSLRQGECEQAIVAGTQAGLAPTHHAVLQRLGALSQSGRCRAFDRAADGYVLG